MFVLISVKKIKNTAKKILPLTIVFITAILVIIRILR